MLIGIYKKLAEPVFIKKMKYHK